MVKSPPSKRPDVTVTHRTPARPGQPGADKTRTDPNPQHPPASPPYSSYEDDVDNEATSVHRDRQNR